MGGSTDQKAKVLIISDEPSTAEVWGFSLQKVGLEVNLIDIPEDVLGVIEKELPDLVVIEDFNIGVEELEICRQLRGITVIPILYLTTKTNENFHLAVYEAGADECIPFPITPRLFQSKVSAWLRRTKNLPLAALDIIQVGGFVFEPDQKQLSLPSGAAVKLTLLETRIVYLLMSHPQKLLRREDLIKKVWGYHSAIDQRLLKNHLYRLRQKIEADPANPRYIVNVGYAGYKFQPDAS